MKHPREIAIRDYTYDLPEKLIAQEPLRDRDASRLLVYQEDRIVESQFSCIDEFLEEGSLLFFNRTKVVQARLYFKKESGAVIQCMCLEPENNTPMEIALQQRGTARWVCMIGNAKRWKDGALQLTCTIDGVEVMLSAFRRSFEGQENTVEFSWTPQNFSFSEILLHSGVLPLPPYMQRDAVEVDKVRYNTVYAEQEGSVAAPTAGLHFTSAVFEKLAKKKIDCEYLTLHVGAGTFKPVKSESMKDHDMHAERIYVTKKQLLTILDYRRSGRKIVCVGTTSLRTLESAYWWGVKILEAGSGEVPFEIGQWEPYDARAGALPTLEESFSAILSQMENKQDLEVSGLTRILIVPGYSFKVVDQLITNFHQPQSTLLLLVAAFIGSDWKTVYDFAMEHNFRFLSYGDSSLLSRTTK